jgi:predicted  nucleic acid-binding Zn-ribbon protein
VEILLVVAIVVVAASGLFVAGTFNMRTERHTEPLITKAVRTLTDEIGHSEKRITSKIDSARTGLERRFDGIDAQLTGIRNDVQAKGVETRSLIGQLAGELAAIKSLSQQISTQLSAQLARIDSDLQQLGHQFGQAGESLDGLSRQMIAIEELIRSRETSVAAGIAQIQKSLHNFEQHQSDIRQEHTAISKTLDQHIQMSRQAQQHDSKTAEQLPDIMQAVETVLRGQGSIQSYLRSGLDYEVTQSGRDRACRLIEVNLYLLEPGADIIWPLLLSFCESIMLKSLLTETPLPNTGASYMVWDPANGPMLEEVLRSKLTACAGISEPSADMEALRSLLAALYLSGPGTIQLGQMIITRTQEALLGCVVTAIEFAQIGNADVFTSPDACEESLRQLGEDRITDLTPWARSLAYE